MSKSAGNGVDPADIMEIYGADALRFTLAAGATETQDLRIPVEPFKLSDGRVINTSERFELGRNFANKFWNAARLALMNLEGYAPAALRLEDLPIEDRWIVDGLDRTISQVTSALEHFQFAEAAHLLRDFTWAHFCDWYLEFAKGRLRDPSARPVAQRVLAALLDGLCRLLHPFMPFVTEQVWQSLQSLAPARGLPEPAPAVESVCIAAWPRALGWSDLNARETVDQWREAITAIRNLKAERNVPKGARIAPIIVAQGAVAAGLHHGEPFLRSLLPADSVTIVSSIERPADCAVAVLPQAEIILPLEGLIDKEAERAKLQKSLAELERQIGASKAKLANESFVARAPADVVALARAKLAELETQRDAVASVLNHA
jgi:valyl-tRNA synthetase